jgi:hypothetical protein
MMGLVVGEKSPQERVRMEAFENLKKLIAAIEDDVKRAEGGNKAAGVRVRSAMQDIKNAAQDVREKILNLRDSDKPAG